MWHIGSNQKLNSTSAAQSSMVSAVRQPDNVCQLPLEITVEGKLAPSYSTFLRPCGYGVVLDTRVIAPRMRVHLNSVYVGDPDGTARSSQHSDAPDCDPVHGGWESVEHARGELDVRWKPSDCLYDHLHRLLDLLEQIGRPARIDVDDAVLRPFEAVEHGQSVAAGRPELPPMSPQIAADLYSWTTMGLDLPRLPRRRAPRLRRRIAAWAAATPLNSK